MILSLDNRISCKIYETQFLLGCVFAQLQTLEVNPQNLI